MPEGWEWVRIKNFCLVIFSGKSPKYSKNETSHKVIGQQANQWSGVNMQYVKYCTNDFVREMPESYYLQNGDVLLNTLGNGTLGRSGIFYNNSSNERVLTDGHLFVFRTQNKVLSKYLLLFLRTKYDEIVKSANGTTNQTFLSLGKTSQWLIPVPPENEIIKIISGIGLIFMVYCIVIPAILDIPTLVKQEYTVTEGIVESWNYSDEERLEERSISIKDDTGQEKSVIVYSTGIHQGEHLVVEYLPH